MRNEQMAKFLNKLEIEQLNKEEFINEYLNSVVFSYSYLTEFNCIICEDNDFYLASCGLKVEGDYYTIINVEFTPLWAIEVINLYEHLLEGVDMEWASAIVEEMFNKYNIKNRLTEEIHIRTYAEGLSE